jgi:heme-degrading monooxygenase HmoA
MFVILWQFEVKPGSEKSFENAYGPAGEWVRLFRRDPHFEQTILLRDSRHPQTYLTLDFWHSEAAYNQFKATHTSDYSATDTATQSLTLSEHHISSSTSIDSPS